MHEIKDLISGAVKAISEPVSKLPATEAETWDWQWNLIGNENPDERKTLDAMLAGAKMFVTDMTAGREPRWLVLVGLPGCGKTHLALRIRDWVLKYGRGIYDGIDRKRVDSDEANYETLYGYAQTGSVMCKWDKLLSRMRAGDWPAFEQASGDWCKIIDDLGVDSFGADGNPTMFAIQKMGALLDRRLRRWTVITTNFTRSQIAEQFDPRIASRLMRGNSVVIDASNVRDYFIRVEEAESWRVES